MATKRLINALAEAIRIDRNVFANPSVETIINSIADVLQKDNARFDRDRFIEACKPNKVLYE